MYDQNQGPISVSEPKPFFPIFLFMYLFFRHQISLMFSYFLGDIDFYKLEKNPNKFSFATKFSGHLMMEKISNSIFPFKSGFSIGYGIDQFGYLVRYWT